MAFKISLAPCSFTVVIDDEYRHADILSTVQYSVPCTSVFICVRVHAVFVWTMKVISRGAKVQQEAWLAVVDNSDRLIRQF